MTMNTKEKVLAALERSKGSYVSGEILAKDCNVSRNAIWKSIAELKKNGYAIRSVNNRGYMLEESSDIISKAGICTCLEKSCGIPSSDAADRIHVYESLDSTNNEAKRGLFFSGRHMIHGTYIIAMQQTAGRGHGGSLFSSPEGGIYMSLILEPDKMKDKAHPVTETAAAVVSGVIEALFSVNAEKKEANSLYVKGEKVGGILTEGICDLETGRFSNYIVGIGIRAGRLQEMLGSTVQRNMIIAALIAALEKGMST